MSFDVSMISFASYSETFSEGLIYLLGFKQERKMVDVLSRDFINDAKDSVCLG